MGLIDQPIGAYAGLAFLVTFGFGQVGAPLLPSEPRKGGYEIVVRDGAHAMLLSEESGSLTDQEVWRNTPK